MIEPEHQHRDETATHEMRLRGFLATHCRTLGIVAAALFVSGIYAYYALIIPPDTFVPETLLTIEEGSSLSLIASKLEQAGVVRSATTFQTLAAVSGNANRLQAGDYYFERPLTVFEVLDRVHRGDTGLTPIVITIPEGATSYEIARTFQESLARFDAATFLTLAREREGYLFPDTYRFFPNATAGQVLDAMEENFYNRIASVAEKINEFGRPLEEVVTMASLLEKEARRHETRQKVAGVLWNRVDIGMPLQVDAVFGYIHSTSTYHPLFSDLEVDSPYNTYKNVGLPPGPIANPGLSSIEAAVTPTSSDYLFYLTGRDGNMYYGRSYDDHLRNRRLYLD